MLNIGKKYVETNLPSYLVAVRLQQIAEGPAWARKIHLDNLKAFFGTELVDRVQNELLKQKVG